MLGCTRLQRMQSCDHLWWAGCTQAICEGGRFYSDSINYGSNFADLLTPDVVTHEEGADGLACSGGISIGPYIMVIFSHRPIAPNSIWRCLRLIHSLVDRLRVYSLTENIPRYPESTCFLVLAQVLQWLRLLRLLRLLQALPSPLPAQALQKLQSPRLLQALPELPSPLLEVVLLIDYSQST
jgi:hypothetical protein